MLKVGLIVEGDRELGTLEGVRLLGANLGAAVSGLTVVGWYVSPEIVGEIVLKTGRVAHGQNRQRGAKGVDEQLELTGEG